MTAHIVREMVEEDLPEVLALYRQPDMDNGQSLDLVSAQGMLERMATYPFYRFYVVVNEVVNEAANEARSEQVSGVFALLIMDNLGHCGAPSGIVEGVCVSPECQGQGLGKLMMQKAMDICREQGCYKMSLSSNIKREKAHAFYRSLGFNQHGVSFQISISCREK